MKTIKYINGNGNELTFTNSWPFLLQNFEQNTGNQIYSFKGSGQDGSRYIGSDLDESELTLEISVKGKDPAEYARNKSRLRRIFNPTLGEGCLVYNNGEKDIQIKCVPEKIPNPKDKSKIYGVCSIALTANDPYWKDLQELKKEIALWVPNFSFPLELSADGIEIGYRSEILTANVYNDGDVESGMRIELKALATVVNPSFVNISTQEFIKLNTTMVKGQVITISTYYGEKRITSKLAGIESNLFNSIAQGSKFLQLEPGDNLFRYDADTGVDYLSVSIYHKDRYLGV